MTMTRRARLVRVGGNDDALLNRQKQDGNGGSGSLCREGYVRGGGTVI
jgi:hypothetical protein